VPSDSTAQSSTSGHRVHRERELPASLVLEEGDARRGDLDEGGRVELAHGEIEPHSGVESGKVGG
jgi:hypothetical protein